MRKEIEELKPKLRKFFVDTGTSKTLLIASTLARKVTSYISETVFNTKAGQRKEVFHF